LKKVYDEYSCNDFVLDDDFRAWVLRHENAGLWEALLLSNPALRTEAERARVIVYALHTEQHPALIGVANEQWLQLDKAVKQADQEQEPAHRISSRSFLSGWQMAAASVMILCCLGAAVFFFKNTFMSAPAVSMQEVTDDGQQKTIVLKDGTKVKLNSGSTLTYPETFASDVREVTLKGEAFFSVTKNPDAPFIIHTGDVTTKVLGTEFNVSAYPESGAVQVAVVSGKVKVNANVKPGAEKNSVCLNPSEMVTFEKKERELLVSPFDAKDQIGWKDGILYFEKSDFPSAMKKLERWYGIRIQLPADSRKLTDADWRFSGKFQDKDIAYILNVMSYPNRFSYTIENKKVNLNL
jgi:transmembrane sensor